MRILVSLGIGLMLMTGCAATGDEQQEQAGKPPITDDCIYVGKLSSWEAFNPRYLYIEDSTDGGQYLIAMGTMCWGIVENVAIDFPYNRGRICQGGGERLRYREAGQMRSCPTEGWKKVAGREEAHALFRAAQ